MKFIGHLDIMRYFQKAMRRADVDICYSEGFSPHQIMSFAAPLGVGLTGCGEYLDIEVHSSAPSAEMVQRLNAVMADGIEVLSYLVLPEGAKNAMSVVAAADYTLTFRDSYKPDDINRWFQELQAFLGQETIPYIKKTKKGEKEMDLKPLIYCCEIRKNSIFLQLSAGSANNLKPEMVIEAFCKSRNEELPRFALQIQREEVYADMGNENKRKLLALDQLGENLE